MVVTLFQTAVLSALETCMNQVIALDPGARNKLRNVSGKVLRVTCTGPAISANIMVADRGLLLTGNDEIPADATVTGTPMALLKRLLTRDTSNLRNDGIVISGDAALVNTLQGIFAGMDVDWEFSLSKVIGDIPTQMLSDSLSGAAAFMKRTGDNLTQDIDDYLHEERRLFPDKIELQRFYRSIDDLRLRVDRLQARTRQLQSRQSS